MTHGTHRTHAFMNDPQNFSPRHQTATGYRSPNPKLEVRLDGNRRLSNISRILHLCLTTNKQVNSCRNRSLRTYRCRISLASSGRADQDRHPLVLGSCRCDNFESTISPADSPQLCTHPLHHHRQPDQLHRHRTHQWNIHLLLRHSIP